jgi:hypothetical protein
MVVLIVQSQMHKYAYEAIDCAITLTHANHGTLPDIPSSLG